MTGKTQSLLNEIQRKVKSRITGEPEFRNKDEVIDAARYGITRTVKKGQVFMSMTTKEEEQQTS